MTQMKQTHERGTPPIRPLFYDFPQDTVSYSIKDAFLFGSDLLVAPIMEYGARQRRVYLPIGAKWTDVWTGESYEGGQWLDAPAPLEHIPLYLRDEAQLPIT